MRNVEIPKWLKDLPLAPEFRPTDTEFADPIAYISQIEREASAFGICKVIPPLPRPSKKYVLHNLNRSLSKYPELKSCQNHCPLLERTNGNEGSQSYEEDRAVFTTRHQELGQSEKRRMKGLLGTQPLGVHKQVWQSGEIYTLDQFETKSKNFAKQQLGTGKGISTLAVEAMFWETSSGKPIYVEYANDIPGSGFGGPDKLFQYLPLGRRKRKRKSFDRNSQRSYGRNALKVAESSSTKNNLNICRQPPSNFFNSEQLQGTISVSDERGSCYDSDVEGTAGWKLSNSPWNLQVIARSPGSLTRFMPDDIPGVTSPMVYIGMLFSWFAWHVEDHELHSLNFLHTGSPKTWYAVPGDYAFSFEEAVRLHACGENVDHLAALTLLGEKTTLLSPELVVRSGIPCCRLVQNPGEFVVTFPRAYHVGFSHGFNCGEAANFGTAKWLTVAKEAALRRAAMNYLPMLSHQQLLYLLTMSFVSRVPRSLLPGARSSRLKDRRKENRELFVKKAFIEDVLEENNLLTILLRRSPFRAVVWNVDLLPSSNNDANLHCGNDGTGIRQNNGDHDDGFCSHLSVYSTMPDQFYVDNDDLPSDFEVDSGALPCVACGVLGFPFMAVVQPSEKTSRCLLAEHCHKMDVSGVLEDMNLHSSSDLVGMFSFSDPGQLKQISHQPDEALLHNDSNKFTYTLNKTTSEVGDSSFYWNENCSAKALQREENKISNGFFRPRIFCLEHAVQAKELLLSKFDASVLVICHSDFWKIKAHAALVAEEIGRTFPYNEIQLDNASPDDLNLIDQALVNEDQDEHTEDWTWELSINLKQCVKVRKTFPFKKVQHVSTLSNLFSDMGWRLSSSCLKWQSKQSRSKQNLKSGSTLCSSAKAKKDISLGSKSGDMIEKTRIIQYSRKKFKSKSFGSVEASKTCADRNNNLAEAFTGAAGEKGEILNRNAFESALTMAGTTGENTLRSEFIASSGKVNLLHGQQVVLTPVDLNNNCLPSEVTYLREVANPAEENFEIYTKSCRFEDLCLKAVSDIRSNNFLMLSELKVVEDGSKRRAKCTCGNPLGLPEIEMTCKGCNLSAADEMGKKSNNQADEHYLIQAAPNSVDSSVCPVDNPSEARFDEKLTDQVVTNKMNGNSEQEIQIVNANYHESAISVSNSTEINDTEFVHGCESCSLPVNRELFPAKTGSKRKGGLMPDQLSFSEFARSPCEGLRPRSRKDGCSSGTVPKKHFKDKVMARCGKKNPDYSIPCQVKKVHKRCHKCDLEGCRMSFETIPQLLLHKHNQCPIDGCGRKFNSHKYASIHQRIHEDNRPLKCPWKGCMMSFKWAWARTEHLRVHTGERPYECKVEGCGLNFRFVSDFSRHRRKTGHYVVANK